MRGMTSAGSIGADSKRVEAQTARYVRNASKFLINEMELKSPEGLFVWNTVNLDC